MQKVTQEETYLLLKNAEKPLSTNEVAKRLNVDWHTAKKRLETLCKNNKIYEKTINNNLTLYWDRPIFE